MKLRSGAWFQGNDEVALDARVAMAMSGHPVYGNLVAMEVEESLRSQPLDGVIVLAACDKSVPAGLMGAFSANLPTLLVMSGPRPSATFQGRRVGTGTDLWRAWDDRRAGKLSD